MKAGTGRPQHGSGVVEEVRLLLLAGTHDRLEGRKHFLRRDRCDSSLHRNGPPRLCEWQAISEKSPDEYRPTQHASFEVAHFSAKSLGNQKNPANCGLTQRRSDAEKEKTPRLCAHV